METVSIILGFIMAIILVYLLYTILNIFVTMYKTKKKDKSLHFCVSKKGTAFYITICVVWILALIAAIYFFIYGIRHDSYTIWLNAISWFTLYTFIISLQLANIVLVGKKHLLIGRLLIDYRKMRKVDLNYRNEMTFVYSQQSYKFSTRWVDVLELRRAIARH